MRPGGRPARPGQEGQAHAHTHGTRALHPPNRNGGVSASTQNSPGAAVKSPFERGTVQETGHVSDRVHTRKLPQRTQPKTDARGTRQGQPHGGGPNRYDAERAYRRCLGSGQGQAQLARFPAAQYIRKRKPPGWGKAPRRQESRSEHRDQTRRGAPTPGHEARRRGTPQATTTAY